MRSNDAQNLCCENPFRAIRLNHTRCLMRMNPEDFEQRDNYGQVPLHIACKLGNIRCVDYLIIRAPQTQDAVSYFGENPVLLAAGVGHEKCVHHLLNVDTKKSLSRALHRDINGTTTLMAALARDDDDLAFWLLTKFGKPLAICPNYFNMLPIHLAASRGNLELIRALTKYDRKMVNKRDNSGLTPIFYAAQSRNLDCARYLIAKCRADVGAVTGRGQSLLQTACLEGHADLVQWLLRYSSPTGILWTSNDSVNALHCATYKGDITLLQLLLKKMVKRKRGTALNIRDSNGNTALHIAASNNNIELLRFLLENGAQASLTNEYGYTAENLAELAGNYRIAKILQNWSDVNSGAEIDFKSTKYNLYETVVPDYYSGYYSIGEIIPSRLNTLGCESRRPISAIMALPNFELSESVVHPLGLIASDEGDRLYFDSECQTEPDPLSYIACDFFCI